MEGLYPFLYAQAGDLEAVHADVRRSTVAKVEEIVALRAEVAALHADRLVACAQQMAQRFGRGGRLFSLGNGGSSTDAQAVAATFLAPGPGWRPLAALCLTNDAATLTALANDIGYEVVFARQIAAHARRDDMVLGLSTSGGSANVLAAFDEAHRRGLLTIGFAGYDGGRMAASSALDYLFVVPSASVHRIQEAQTTLYNVLWELTQQALDDAAPGQGG